MASKPIDIHWIILEPDLSLAEKSYMIFYYIQFSTNINMCNHKIKENLLAHTFVISLRANKTKFIFLYIIRCDK